MAPYTREPDSRPGKRVGLAVGFTLLGATLIYVLTRSFVLNLPLVGNFLGELVWIIQEYLKARP